MTEEQNLNNEQQHEESINLYAIFFKYLAYWPWFVASVLVCLILAFAYLRYQAPVYNVTSAVLIKEDDSNKRGMGAAGGALEAMQSLSGLISRCTRALLSMYTCRPKRRKSWKPVPN